VGQAAVCEVPGVADDGKAVKMWDDLDTALDNVARGIRAVVEAKLAESS
jgi:hypothetical protein